MKEIKVSYDGNVKTTVTNGKSPIVLKTDNSEESNANGSTLTPVDMFVGSVGACMLSMIGYTAAKKGISVDGTTASMTYDQDPATHAVSEISVDFHICGGPFDEKTQKIIAATAKACPVAASINQAIKKNLTFEFC